MITAIEGPLTVVHDTQKHELGVMHEKSGKIYIYLKGVASTVAGDVVTFDEAGATTRLVKAEADKLKPIAVALAAVVANKYGWYQVYGETSLSALGLCAKEVAIYTSATAGAVDDDPTAQTKINRLIVRTTVGASAAVTAAFINFPSAG